MPKLLDASDELQVIRFGNGIKLLRPNQESTCGPFQGWDTGYSVQSLLQLPFSIYFFNTDSELQKANRILFENTTLATEKDCLGKTAHAITSQKFAIQLIKNDRDVLNNNRIKIIEERGVREDNYDIHAVSIKLPWYDQRNKIIGLLGCSVILEIHSIVDFIAKIAELGLLNNFPNSHYFNAIQDNIYLSQRERQVLEYTLTGLSARKIGSSLKISQRTVEYHLENIKSKFGVYSKSELIEKSIKSILCK